MAAAIVEASGPINDRSEVRKVESWMQELVARCEGRDDITPLLSTAMPWIRQSVRVLRPITVCLWTSAFNKDSKEGKADTGSTTAAKAPASSSCSGASGKGSKFIEDYFPAVPLDSAEFRQRVVQLRQLLRQAPEWEHLHLFLKHSTTTIPGYIIASTGYSQAGFRIVSMFLQHLLQLSIPLFFLDIAHPGFLVGAALASIPVQMNKRSASGASANGSTSKQALQQPVYARPPGSDFKLCNAQVSSSASFSSSYYRSPQTAFAPNVFNMFGFLTRVTTQQSNNTPASPSNAGRQAPDSPTAISGAPTSTSTTAGSQAPSDSSLQSGSEVLEIENGELLDEKTKLHALAITPRPGRKVVLSKQLLSKLSAILPKWSFRWPDHAAVVAEASASIKLIETSQNPPVSSSSSPSGRLTELVQEGIDTGLSKMTTPGSDARSEGHAPVSPAGSSTLSSPVALASPQSIYRTLTLAEMSRLYDDVADLTGDFYLDLKVDNASEEVKAELSPHFFASNVKLQSPGFSIDDAILRNAYHDASSISSNAHVVCDTPWSAVGGLSVSKLDTPAPVSSWEEYITGVSSSERERIKNHPTVTLASYHQLRCIATYLRANGPSLFCARLKLAVANRSGEGLSLPPVEHAPSITDYVASLASTMHLITPEERQSIAKEILAVVPEYYMSASASPQPSMQVQLQLQNALDYLALRAGIKETEARFIRDQFSVRAAFRALEAPSEQGALRISGAVRLADIIDRAIASRMLKVAGKASNWVLSILRPFRDRSGDVGLDSVPHDRALSLSIPSVLRLVRRRELLHVLTAPESAHAETIRRAKSVLRAFLFTNVLELSDLAALWRIMIRGRRQVAHEATRHAIFEVILDLVSLLPAHVKSPFSWFTEKETAAALGDQAQLRQARLRAMQQRYKTVYSDENQLTAAGPTPLPNTITFPILFSQAERDLIEVLSAVVAATPPTSSSGQSSGFFGFGSTSTGGVATESELAALEVKVFSDADYTTLFEGKRATARHSDALENAVSKDILLYECSTSSTSSGLGADQLADWSFFDPILGQYHMPAISGILASVNDSSSSPLQSNQSPVPVSKVTAANIAVKLAGIFRDFFDLCIARTPLECMDTKFISFVETYTSHVSVAFAALTNLPPLPKPRFEPKSSPTASIASAHSVHASNEGIISPATSPLSSEQSLPSLTNSDPTDGQLTIKQGVGITTQPSSSITLPSPYADPRDEDDIPLPSSAYSLHCFTYVEASPSSNPSSAPASQPTSPASTHSALSSLSSGPQQKKLSSEVLGLLSAHRESVATSTLFSHYYAQCGLEQPKGSDSDSSDPEASQVPHQLLGMVGASSAAAWLWCFIATSNLPSMAPDEAGRLVTKFRSAGIARLPVPVLLAIRRTGAQAVAVPSIAASDDDDKMTLSSSASCNLSTIATAARVTLLKLLTPDQREPLRRAIATNCVALLRETDSKVNLKVQSDLVRLLRDLYALYPHNGGELPPANPPTSGSSQWIQTVLANGARVVSRGAFAVYLESKTRLSTILLDSLCATSIVCASAADVDGGFSELKSSTEKTEYFPGSKAVELFLDLLATHVSAGLARARLMIEAGKPTTKTKTGSGGDDDIYEGVSREAFQSSPVLRLWNSTRDPTGQLDIEKLQAEPYDNLVVLRSSETDLINQVVSAIRVRSSGLRDVPLGDTEGLEGVPVLTPTTLDRLWDAFVKNSYDPQDSILQRRRDWFVSWLATQVSHSARRTRGGSQQIVLVSPTLQNALVHYLLEKLTALPRSAYLHCRPLVDLFQRCFALVHIASGNVLYEGPLLRPTPSLESFGRLPRLPPLDFSSLRSLKFDALRTSPLREMDFLWGLYFNVSSNSSDDIVRAVGDLLLALHLPTKVTSQGSVTAGSSSPETTPGQTTLVTTCLYIINQGLTAEQTGAEIKSSVQPDQDRRLSDPEGYKDVVLVTSCLPTDVKLQRAVSLIRRFVAKVSGGLHSQDGMDLLGNDFDPMKTVSPEHITAAISELALKSFDVPVRLGLMSEEILTTLNATTAAVAFAMSTRSEDRHLSDSTQVSSSTTPNIGGGLMRDSIRGGDDEKTDTKQEQIEMLSELLGEVERALPSYGGMTYPLTPCGLHTRASAAPRDTESRTSTLGHSSTPQKFARYLLTLLQAAERAIMPVEQTRRAVRSAISLLLEFINQPQRFVTPGRFSMLPLEVESACYIAKEELQKSPLRIHRAVLSPWSAVTKDKLALNILAAETGLKMLSGVNLAPKLTADSASSDPPIPTDQVIKPIAMNYAKVGNQAASETMLHGKDLPVDTESQSSSIRTTPLHAAFPAVPGYIVPFVQLVASLFIPPADLGKLIAIPASSTSPFKPAAITRVVFEFDDNFGGRPPLPLYLPLGVADTLVVAALLLYLRLDNDEVARLRLLPKVGSADASAGSISAAAKLSATDITSTARSRARNTVLGGAEDRLKYSPVDVVPALSVALLRDVALQADLMWLMQEYAKQDGRKDTPEEAVAYETELATELVEQSSAASLSTPNTHLNSLSGVGRHSDIDYGSSALPASVWSELSGLGGSQCDSQVSVPLRPFESYDGASVFKLGSIHATAPFSAAFAKLRGSQSSEEDSSCCTMPAPRTIPFLSVSIPASRYFLFDAPTVPQPSSKVSVLCVEPLSESIEYLQGMDHATTVAANMSSPGGRSNPTGVAAELSTTARTAAAAVAETPTVISIAKALAYGIVKPGTVLRAVYKAAADSGLTADVGSLTMSAVGPGARFSSSPTTLPPPPTWSPEFATYLSPFKSAIGPAHGSRTEDVRTHIQTWASVGTASMLATVYSGTPIATGTGVPFGTNADPTSAFELNSDRGSSASNFYGSGMFTQTHTLGSGNFVAGSAIASNKAVSSSVLAAGIPCTLPGVKCVFDMSQIQVDHKQQALAYHRKRIQLGDASLDEEFPPTSFYSMSHPYFLHANEDSTKPWFAGHTAIHPSLLGQRPVYEARLGATTLFDIPSLLSPRMLPESTIGYLLPRIRQFVHSSETQIAASSGAHSAAVQPLKVRQDVLYRLAMASGAYIAGDRAKALSALVSIPKGSYPSAAEAYFAVSTSITNYDASSRLNPTCLAVEDVIRSTIPPSLAPQTFATLFMGSGARDGASSALAAVGCRYTALTRALRHLKPDQPAAAELLSLLTTLTPGSDTLANLNQDIHHIVSYLSSLARRGERNLNVAAIHAWDRSRILDSTSFLVQTLMVAQLESLVKGRMVPLPCFASGFVDFDLLFCQETTSVLDHDRKYAKQGLWSLPPDVTRLPQREANAISTADLGYPTSAAGGWNLTSPSIVSSTDLSTVPHPLLLLSHPSVALSDMLVQCRFHIALINELRLRTDHTMQVSDLSASERAQINPSNVPTPARSSHWYAELDSELERIPANVSHRSILPYFVDKVHGTRNLHVMMLQRVFGLLHHLFEVGALLAASRRSARETERSVGACVRYLHILNTSQNVEPPSETESKASLSGTDNMQIELPGLDSDSVNRLASFILEALAHVLQCDEGVTCDATKSTVSQAWIDSFVIDALKLFSWCAQSQRDFAVLTMLFDPSNARLLRHLIVRSLLQPGCYPGSSPNHPKAVDLRRTAAHAWLAMLSPPPFVNQQDTNTSERAASLDQLTLFRAQFLNAACDVLDPLDATGMLQGRSMAGTRPEWSYGWRWSGSNEFTLLVAELLPLLRDRLIVNYINVSLIQRYGNEALFGKARFSAAETIGTIHECMLRLNTIAIGRLLATQSRRSMLSELTSGALGVPSVSSVWDLQPRPLSREDRSGAAQCHLRILQATWTIAHSVQVVASNLSKQTGLSIVTDLSTRLTSRILDFCCLSAALDAIYSRGLAAVSVESFRPSRGTLLTLNSYFSAAFSAKGDVDANTPPTPSHAFEKESQLVTGAPESDTLEQVSAGSTQDLSSPVKAPLHVNLDSSLPKPGEMITQGEASRRLALFILKARREFNGISLPHTQADSCSNSYEPEIEVVDLKSEVTSLLDGVDSKSERIGPVLKSLQKPFIDAKDILVDSRGALFRSRQTRIAALAALHTLVLIGGTAMQYQLIDRVRSTVGPLSTSYLTETLRGNYSTITAPLLTLTRPPRAEPEWIGAVLGSTSGGDLSAVLLKALGNPTNATQTIYPSDRPLSSLSGQGALGLGAYVVASNSWKGRAGMSTRELAELKELGYGPDSITWLGSNDQLIPESSGSSVTEPLDGRGQSRLGTGLVNLGATCYMNSTFQALCSSPIFRALVSTLQPYLSDPTTGSTPGDNQTKLTASHFLLELQRAVLSLSMRDRASVHLRRLIPFFKDEDAGPLNVGQHKDAQEFVSSLLNLITDAIAALTNPTHPNEAKSAIYEQPSSTKQYFIPGLGWANVPPSEIFANAFAGEICHQVVSQECPHTSERPERFFTLTAVIKNKASLKESLQTMIEGEMLDGDNKYFCSECQKKVVAVRRDCISRLPPCLFIHLKRFEFNFTTMSNSDKLNDHFEFPPLIDLFPFTREGLMSSSEAVSGGEVHDSVTSRPTHLYRAAAIVVHVGRAEAGHYYVYVRGDNLPGPAAELRSLEATAARARSKLKLLLSESSATPEVLPPTLLARLDEICFNTCRSEFAAEAGQYAKTPAQSTASESEIWSGVEDWVEFNDQGVSLVHASQIPDLTFGGTQMVTTQDRWGQAITREEPKTHNAYLVLYEAVGVSQLVPESPTLFGEQPSDKVHAHSKEDAEPYPVVAFTGPGYELGGLMESVYYTAAQRATWLHATDPALRTLFFNLWASRGNDYHVDRHHGPYAERIPAVITQHSSNFLWCGLPSLSITKQIQMLSTSLRTSEAIFSAALQFAVRTVSHSAHPQTLVSWRALLKHILFPLAPSNLTNLLHGSSVTIYSEDTPSASSTMASSASSGLKAYGGLSSMHARLLFLLRECVSMSPLGRTSGHEKAASRVPDPQKESHAYAVMTAWEVGFAAREAFLSKLVEGIDISFAQPHLAYAASLLPFVIVDSDGQERSPLTPPSLTQLVHGQATLHRIACSGDISVGVEPVRHAGVGGFNSLPPLAQELWLRASQPLQALWLELALFAFRVHILHRDLREYVHHPKNNGLEQLEMPLSSILPQSAGQDLTRRSTELGYNCNDVPTPTRFLAGLVACIPSLRYVAASPPVGSKLVTTSLPTCSRNTSTALAQEPTSSVGLTFVSPSIDLAKSIAATCGIQTSHDLYTARLHPLSAYYPGGAAAVNSIFGFITQLAKTGTSELAYLISLGLSTSLVRFYCDTQPEIPGFNCEHGSGESEITRYPIATTTKEIAAVAIAEANADSRANSRIGPAHKPMHPPALPNLFTLLEYLVLATETRARPAPAGRLRTPTDDKWAPLAVDADLSSLSLNTQVQHMRQQDQLRRALHRFITGDLERFTPDTAIERATPTESQAFLAKYSQPNNMKSIVITAAHRLLPAYSAPLTIVPRFIPTAIVERVQKPLCESKEPIKVALMGVTAINPMSSEEIRNQIRELTVPVESDLSVVFGRSANNPLQFRATLKPSQALVALVAGSSRSTTSIETKVPNDEACTSGEKGNSSNDEGREEPTTSVPIGGPTIWDMINRLRPSFDPFVETHSNQEDRAEALLTATSSLLRNRPDSNYPSTQFLLEHALSDRVANAALYFPSLVKIFAHYLKFDLVLQLWVSHVATEKIVSALSVSRAESEDHAELHGSPEMWATFTCELLTELGDGTHPDIPVTVSKRVFERVQTLLTEYRRVQQREKRTPTQLDIVYPIQVATKFLLRMASANESAYRLLQTLKKHLTEWAVTVKEVAEAKAEWKRKHTYA